MLGLSQGIFITVIDTVPYLNAFDFLTVHRLFQVPKDPNDVFSNLFLGKFYIVSKGGKEGRKEGSNPLSNARKTFFINAAALGRNK
jgi:hypothetical protein